MSTFLEKYRLYIGSSLVLVILIGCGALLWQKQKLSKIESDQKSEQNSEFTTIKTENEELQNKLKELEDKINSLEEEKKEMESGKIAGASSVDSSSSNESSSSSSSQTSSSYSQPTSDKININTASAKELEELPGVGPTRAQQIIGYRQENGGFKTIEEIQNIKGIGPKTFEKMRDMITVE